MQTTEQFYGDFKEAGFLVPASWTPSVAAGGGATKSTHVRFRQMDDEYADGMVVAAFPSISYPASWLPGLIEGEAITLNLSSLGQGSAVAFKVRKPPMRIKDGTETKAYLKAV